MDRPANGLPEDLRDHARLMCDIIATAFQTNKTRVASLIISRDLSAMYYPFLDVKEGHHSASHNNNSDGYERIPRFHVEQYAYLATKLASMKEGNGSVLDNTCLMFLSNMWIARRAIGLPSQRSSSSFVSSRRNWHFRRRRVRSPRMLRWATLNRRNLVLRALYHSEHLRLLRLL
jgi:hypothetical protein